MLEYEGNEFMYGHVWTCMDTWFLVNWVGIPKTHTPRSLKILFCPRLFALKFWHSRPPKIGPQLSCPILPLLFHIWAFSAHTYLLCSFPCCLWYLPPLLTQIPLHPLITNAIFSMSFLTCPCLAFSNNLIWLIFLWSRVSESQHYWYFGLILFCCRRLSCSL